MMDVSVIRQLLGPDLYMAAVFDAFSRVPLFLSVFDRATSASDMARLLRSTARVFAAPKYLITDRGGEFTGDAFQCMVKRFLIVQRFAAAENLYATSRLERFWLTLKDSARLRWLCLPLTRHDLERRLEFVLHHYVVFRPHEASVGPRSENGSSVCRPPTRTPASLPEAGQVKARPATGSRSSRSTLTAISQSSPERHKAAARRRRPFLRWTPLPQRQRIAPSATTDLQA
jgi:transposase InsO family protein